MGTPRSFLHVEKHVQKSEKHFGSPKLIIKPSKAHAYAWVGLWMQPDGSVLRSMPGGIPQIPATNLWLLLPSENWQSLKPKQGSDRGSNNVPLSENEVSMSIPQHLFLLGAPGAGKSTLRKNLPYGYQFHMGEKATQMGFAPSTGDLRPNWKEVAQTIPSSVPVLMDGFPRSIEQVEYLKSTTLLADSICLFIPMSQEESTAACLSRGDSHEMARKKWDRYTAQDLPAVLALASAGVKVVTIARRSRELMVQDAWKAIGLPVADMSWDWTQPLDPQICGVIAAWLGWGPARKDQAGSLYGLSTNGISISGDLMTLEALVRGSWVKDFERWPQAPGSPAPAPKVPSKGLQRPCSEALAIEIKRYQDILGRIVVPPAMVPGVVDHSMSLEAALVAPDAIWRPWLVEALHHDPEIIALNQAGGNARVWRAAHFQGHVAGHQAHAAYLLDTEGLSDLDRASVRLAALCHDVGKGKAQATSGAHAGAGAAMIRRGEIPLPACANRERVAELVARHGEPGNVIKGALAPDDLGSVSDDNLGTLSEAHWRLWMADVGTLPIYRWTIELAPMLKAWAL